MVSMLLLHLELPLKDFKCSLEYLHDTVNRKVFEGLSPRMVPSIQEIPSQLGLKLSLEICGYASPIACHAINAGCTRWASMPGITGMPAVAGLPGMLGSAPTAQNLFHGYGIWILCHLLHLKVGACSTDGTVLLVSEGLT